MFGGATAVPPPPQDDDARVDNDGPPVMVGTRKKASLLPLLCDGRIAAGQVLNMNSRFAGARVLGEAHVDADGIINDHSDNTMHATPSGWALHRIKQAGVNAKCNGWLHVTFGPDKTPIDSLRDNPTPTRV